MPSERGVIYLYFTSFLVGDNWCFPAVRLCKKHVRESRVSRVHNIKKHFYEKAKIQITGYDDC